MRRVLDRLRALLRPPTSPHLAVVLARSECRRRGLPWEEPVRVYRRLGVYEVWTAAERQGGNVVVEVDVRDGTVRRVRGPLPR